ncbi:ParA family protein [Paraburkholderia largidicola]|uniref:Cobyric acid synthase CobQ n=1 Tax=Paraburkholderia largidicola TaxID=3014751 RepID=A0A7I8C2X0_9BURK|nr:ParA family protein [Paraburkholderia sp. PGU16]BCF95407.1 cobyric acid synthase CobQ [Paraburkholderia sp. PGU16]
MKSIAVVNQKGGISKTTVATHIAYAGAEAGLRVLLVDLDRQGSASLTFLPAEDAEPGLMASTLFAEDATPLRPEVLGPNLSIIRADKGLSLLTGVNESVLKRPRQHLKRLAADYDLCVIDTPGNIDFSPPMTAGALVAAEAVVCPFPVGLYESAALTDLLAFLKKIREQGYNPGLRLLGLLPARINTKSKEERDALDQLRKQLGKMILPTMLAERTSVKQSTARRRPVWKGTKGAGHRVAAQEWKAAMNLILNDLGVTQ